MQQAGVVELINNFDNNLNEDTLRCKFKIEFENNTPSTKNTHLNNEDGEFQKFRKVLNHSLISGKKGKDDKIEIQLVWETSATSTECFEVLKKDILVDLAIYAKENNLLEPDGLKILKRLADRSKLTKRLVKQAKLCSLKYSTTYKYGYEIPKNYKDVECLNKQNGNTNQMNVNKLEHKQVAGYDAFKDRGFFAGCMIPCSYQLIRVHTKVDR